jgi:hypothetical protein
VGWILEGLKRERVKLGLRERERDREGDGGSERHYIRVGWEHYFLFEGSQAMPASPSDRSEVLLATCSSTYSPVRTSQEAHSVSISKAIPVTDREGLWY